MRKLLLTFVLFLMLSVSVKADVLPCYLGNINPNSIGVYQASEHIKLFKEPNERSALLLDVSWTGENFVSPDVSASNLFVSYLPKRNLAFLTVTDENQDGDWVEVSFNQNGLKTGWLKKEDDFRFMNWRTFFNLYGRKYGLRYLKDAPESSKIIYGSTVENAKSLGKITLPNSLKLTNISGNWLLVIALDVDRTQKIGWIKWRDITGQIYLFPDLK